MLTYMVKVQLIIRNALGQTNRGIKRKQENSVLHY